MSGNNLQKLPKKDLINIITMLSKNWYTVDGLWFQGVEEKYGMVAAMELDLRMWERMPLIEARRIKETVKIKEKGIEGVMKTINFMSWALAYPFECEEVTPARAVMVCRDCVPQRSRASHGQEEFPCRTVGEAMFRRIIEAIDPRVQFRCLNCPPGEHPKEFWCKWELTLPTDTPPRKKVERKKKK